VNNAEYLRASARARGFAFPNPHYAEDRGVLDGGAGAGPRGGPTRCGGDGSGGGGLERVRAEPFVPVPHPRAAAQGTVDNNKCSSVRRAASREPVPHPGTELNGVRRAPSSGWHLRKSRSGRWVLPFKHLDNPPNCDHSLPLAQKIALPMETRRLSSNTSTGVRRDDNSGGGGKN